MQQVDIIDYNSKYEINNEKPDSEQKRHEREVSVTTGPCILLGLEAYV